MSRSPRRPRPGYPALPLLLLFVGAVLLGFGVWQSGQSLRAAGWPVATGTVTRSQAVPAGRLAERRGWRPEVQYTYRADGLTYRGERLNFFRLNTTSLRGARRILERYPVGQPVAVHYDPRRPSRSVLQVGLGLSWPLWLLGAASLTLGGAVWWAGRGGERWGGQGWLPR
ncbi:DUF3592 domain-containing protein [Deinococcus sedimenti]|nr:DUF3592 domain-containing protein [Deinococcus sedimenti]